MFLYDEEECDQLFKSLKPINIVKGYSTVNCKIDDKLVWDINKFKNLKVFSCKKVLPSDSTNRKDMNY